MLLEHYGQQGPLPGGALVLRHQECEEDQPWKESLPASRKEFYEQKKHTRNDN